MSEPKREIPWISGDFSENRRKFPPEQLLQYAGQVLAWSLDGRELLGHGTDEEAVRQELTAKGLNPDHAVWEELLPPDIGGLLGAGADLMEDEDATPYTED